MSGLKEKTGLSICWGAWRWHRAVVAAARPLQSPVELSPSLGPSLAPQRGCTALCLAAHSPPAQRCPPLALLLPHSAGASQDPASALHSPGLLRTASRVGTSQKMMSVTNYSTSWVLPRAVQGLLPPSTPWGRSPSACPRRWAPISLLPVSPSRLLRPRLRAGTGEVAAAGARPRGTYKAEYFLTD